MMEAVETTVQQIAAEAASYFEGSKRDNGDYFRKLKNGSPEWVTQIVYAAHHGWSDFLPDDWRYEWCEDALRFIAEADDPDDSGEFADAAVSIYTDDRLRWLSSNLNRPSYCDEAQVEFGGSSEMEIIDRIGWGQYMEASEVYGLVLRALNDRLEQIEE